MTRSNQTLHVAYHLDTSRQGTLTVQTDFLALGDYAALAEQFLPLSSLGGAVEDATLTWTNNARGSQLSGQADLRQVGATYIYEGQPLALTADGHVSFDNLRFTAQNLDVTVNGQKARFQGRMDLTDSQNPRMEKLQVKLEDFDPSALSLDLLAEGKISGEAVVSGTLDDLTGTGTFTIPELTVQGYTATQVELPFTVRKHRVETDGARAKHRWRSCDRESVL